MEGARNTDHAFRQVRVWIWLACVIPGRMSAQVTCYLYGLRYFLALREVPDACRLPGRSDAGGEPHHIIFFLFAVQCSPPPFRINDELARYLRDPQVPESFFPGSQDYGIPYRGELRDGQQPPCGGDVSH